MKRSGATVLAGFALTALFIAGAFYLGREIVQLYGDLGAQFLAISILTVVTALIVAGGLRAAGDSKARIHRLRNKADTYSEYLCDLGHCELPRCTTAQALALWASPSVLRVIDSKPNRDDGDAPFKAWLTLLIRAMRQDTGQSNIQLKLESIVDSIFTAASVEDNDSWKLN